MQSDFFLSSLINGRGVPSVALPLDVLVIRADRLRNGAVKCLDIDRTGEDAVAAICAELRKLGHPATHVQVYDGAVACFFLSVLEGAKAFETRRQQPSGETVSPAPRVTVQPSFF